MRKRLGTKGWLHPSKHRLARVYEAEGRADLAAPLGQEALKIYERLQHKDVKEVKEFVKRLEKR